MAIGASLGRAAAIVWRRSWRPVGARRSARPPLEVLSRSGCTRRSGELPVPALPGLFAAARAAGRPEMGNTRKRGKTPPHQPEVPTSPVFEKRGWYHIDLRIRGAGRPILRDPDAPGWPEKGERTRDKATAEEWARVYDARWRKQQEEAAQRETGEFRSLGLGVEHFLCHRKRQNAASTYSGSCTATSHLLEWMGPNADPADVSGDDLQEMFDFFIDEGYEPSSMHNLRNHLRRLFDYMKIAPNPARAVALPKPDASDIVPWNEKQRSRIREMADEIDRELGDSRRIRRRLVECLFGMGPRIQEAAALMWEDIDPATMTVRISKQIARATKRPASTKGKEPRSATVLEEWWDVHDDSATGLIVCRADGTPIPYRTLYDHVSEILERAGVKAPGIAAHYFRHTYAFLFLEREGTLDELSKCLGHKKLSTTQRYYEHFTSEHAARAAARRMYGAGTIRRGPRKKP